MLSERQPQRRLLLLLPFAPRLDATHGGSRVMAELIVRLASRHRIALLYLRGIDEPPIDGRVQERCQLVEEVLRPVASRPLARQWRRIRLTSALIRGKPMWVSDWSVAEYGKRVRTLARTWRPDLVHVQYHLMGQYLCALDGCPAPRVLTEIEPGVLAAPYLGQSNRALTRTFHYLDKVAWKRYEGGIIPAFNAVVVLTEHDRQAIARLRVETTVVQIPFGTAVPQKSLNPLGRPPLSLLFVGSFTHPPNVDAALRLIRVIFPQLQKRYQELILYIVGDQPTRQMRDSANEKVIITGCVPDVMPYLDRAALVVVPLRLGGGMRVKVLEALAAGKAVVASPLAIEGLDLVDGEHAILAKSDQQFSDAVNQLLADPERRASLAARARAWACANLGWEKCIAAHEALYQSLLERPVEHPTLPPR